MSAQYLSTSEAHKLLGLSDYNLLAEVRRKLPDFPCNVGTSTRDGNEWKRADIEKIGFLQKQGLPWLIAARVAALGNIAGGVFVIAPRNVA